MRDRPEYVIYYLSKRLKFLEENRPRIYHVFDSKGKFNCTITSEKLVQELENLRNRPAEIIKEIEYVDKIVYKDKIVY